MKRAILPVMMAALAAAVLVGCNQDLAEYASTSAAPGGTEQDTLIDYGHWGALYPHQYNLSQVLVYAIQDEHLAQGEYQYVIRQFGSVAPFRCIVRAEGNHIAALQNLIVQRGEPVPPNQSAQYLIPVNTIREALAVGVEAEEQNIAMYNLFLSRRDLPANFRTVFTNLRDASICHLAAFRRRLGN